MFLLYTNTHIPNAENTLLTMKNGSTSKEDIEMMEKDIEQLENKQHTIRKDYNEYVEIFIPNAEFELDRLDNKHTRPERTRKNLERLKAKELEYLNETEIGKRKREGGKRIKRKTTKRKTTKRKTTKGKINRKGSTKTARRRLILQH